MIETRAIVLEDTSDAMGMVINIEDGGEASAEHAPRELSWLSWLSCTAVWHTPVRIFQEDSCASNGQVPFLLDGHVIHCQLTPSKCPVRSKLLW